MRATLPSNRHETLQPNGTLSSLKPSRQEGSKYLDLVLKKRETKNALYEKKLKRQKRQGLTKGQQKIREKRKQRDIARREERKQKRNAPALVKAETEDRRLAALPKSHSPSTRTAVSLAKGLAEVKYSLPTSIAYKIPHISQSILSYHYETTPPSAAQIHSANRFFLQHRSTPLFSTTKFFTQPMTGIPEVCFLGRSNAGKSSLLNALTGQKDLCHVSDQPGRTRSMAGYAVGGQQSDGKKGKLVLMDMPGYGQGSRPEWGKEIGRYLASRKELRRVFVVVDAEVGLKKHDEEMLALLRQQGISHQVLLGKVDRVLLMGLDKKGSERKVMSKATHLVEVERLREKVDRIMALVQPEHGTGPGALGEILCVASKGAMRENTGLGLGALRWAILQATGLNWSGETVKTEDILEKEGSDTSRQRAAPMKIYSHGSHDQSGEAGEGHKSDVDDFRESANDDGHRFARTEHPKPNINKSMKKEKKVKHTKQKKVMKNTRPK